MSPKFRAQRVSQKGFSLIEVLIALVVLAIGLLGLAALQTIGLRYNHGSYQETQATILTYNIIDRMRANTTGRDSALYDTIDTSSWTATTDNCFSGSCDATELRNYDIDQWQNNILTYLGPTAIGTISTSGTVRTVKLDWLERDIRQTFIVEVEL